MQHLYRDDVPEMIGDWQLVSEQETHGDHLSSVCVNPSELKSSNKVQVEE